jgi:hypothetical protein
MCKEHELSLERKLFLSKGRICNGEPNFAGVLRNFEEHIIVAHPHIKFYRNVDDIFAIIKSRFLKQILADINSFNQQGQFTVEEEENGSISFLDVLLTRKDIGKLSKKVYRKPTHTDKYLNFQSYHHLSQKVSVIDSLVYRAIRICDDEFLQEELNHMPHKK